MPYPCTILPPQSQSACAAAGLSGGIGRPSAPCSRTPLVLLDSLQRSWVSVIVRQSSVLTNLKLTHQSEDAMACMDAASLTQPRDSANIAGTSVLRSAEQGRGKAGTKKRGTFVDSSDFPFAPLTQRSSLTLTARTAPHGPHTVRCRGARLGPRPPEEHWEVARGAVQSNTLTHVHGGNYPTTQVDPNRRLLGCPTGTNPAGAHPYRPEPGAMGVHWSRLTLDFTGVVWVWWWDSINPSVTAAIAREAKVVQQCASKGRPAYVERLWSVGSAVA